jgi:hypothetical protein
MRKEEGLREILEERVREQNLLHELVIINQLILEKIIG